MKEFFTIGEISKLFNINSKTLRYYDEIDLFKPSYVDEHNKYRYYSICILYTSKILIVALFYCIYYKLSYSCIFKGI